MLLGCPSIAKQKLDLVRAINFKEMCSEMVFHDLEEAKRHALLKQYGYQAPVSLE